MSGPLATCYDRTHSRLYGGRCGARRRFTITTTQVTDERRVIANVLRGSLGNLAE